MQLPQEAVEWLDKYSSAQTAATGALEPYRIRRRAIDGWDEVVQRWSRKSCTTPELRRVEVASVQEETEKFGHASLFEHLASGEAEVVWKRDGKPDANILKTYVSAKEAEWRQRHFKAPAFRHPDPFFHPVFLDLGKSRPALRFNKYGNDDRMLTLELWSGKSVVRRDFLWQGTRFRTEILAGIEGSGRPLPRLTRLTKAEAGNPEDPRVDGIQELANWNGRLQVDRFELAQLGKKLEKGGDAAAKLRLRWFLTISPPIQIPEPPLAQPNEDASRALMARIGYARRPGLRVLAVDLGHRVAAACAVLETMSRTEIDDEFRAVGCPAPSPDALWATCKDKFGRWTCYRRIGPDDWNGGEHPAPWAKIVRRFEIRLQGEKDPLRRASGRELDTVGRIFASLGLSTPSEGITGLELMSTTVDHLIRRLRHHCRLLSIAELLDRADAGARVKALGRLFAMARETDWAANLWRTHLPEISLESRLRKQRDEMLLLASQALDEDACQKIAAACRARWQDEDGRWPLERLRPLRNLLLPSQKALGMRRGAWRTASCLGGLRLDRIELYQSYYQLLRAFAGRPTPAEPVGVPAGTEYAQTVLDTLDRLRQSRVRQLGSRIVEAALGFGQEPAGETLRPNRRARVRPDDPRFAPCPLIVIEKLSEYRPDETRLRRENRRLMSWSARRLAEQLRLAAEIHGIRVAEYPAQYSSRQDSLTGSPGVRCSRVELSALIGDSYWVRQVERAREAGDARSRFLLKLAEMAEAAPQVRVLIPNPGGEVFVSANECSPGTLAQHADLNAAVNMGLRAVMDPDWPGKWWRVPCDAKTGLPLDRETKGAGPFACPAPLLEPSGDAAKKEVVNAWRDPSAAPCGLSFQGYSSYWNGVMYRVVKRLMKEYIEHG